MLKGRFLRKEFMLTIDLMAFQQAKEKSGISTRNQKIISSISRQIQKVYFKYIETSHDTAH